MFFLLLLAALALWIAVLVALGATSPGRGGDDRSHRAARGFFTRV
ncbi:hypothetical protein [Herbiconiux sp. UC225_62]